MSVHPIDSAPSRRLFDEAPVATLSDAELGERIVGYAGQMAALTARFLDMLAEFDTRGAWSGVGIVSCAHWLAWRTGLTLRTAQDHVRIARALPELPLLAAAFGAGELTYSKVRALTRVATAEREPELLKIARSATADQLERVVSAIRAVDRHGDGGEGDGTEPDIDSCGRWKWNYDGSLSVSLRFSALDGAVFLAAVVRAEYERTRTEDDVDVPLNALTAPEPPQHRDVWRHVPADIAPAVVAMADTIRTVVDAPGVVPAAEVIVHTHIAGDDAETQVPDPHLDNGPALSDTETAEAQCAAATSTTVVSGGIRLQWGRDRRYPTRRLVQLIVQRDRSCRHPGCGRTRHLHIHHVTYWSNGGLTNPDNLILLCSTHHRALHRGEFTITGHGRQRFTFHDPDGAILEYAPPLRAASNWTPDPRIAPNATVPAGGGKLNLHYAIEVLYRIWDHKQTKAA